MDRWIRAYDAAGNRTEQTTSVGTTWYGYDPLNRLTSACTAATCAPPGGIPLGCLACVTGTLSRPAATIVPNPADTLTTFTYDPVGNRLSQITYLGTTSSGYDAADRLTSVTPPGGGPITYTYDAVGNQLSAGSTSYAYDLADRLTSATVAGTTETYAYAGDGVRLSAATGSGPGTITFAWDRAFGLPQVALERDGSGALVRRSSYGLGLTAVSTPAATGLLHPDPLGSVSDVVAPNGTPQAWREYAPFGALRFAGLASDAPSMPYGFTGQYRDAATGLYHLRARQYDPGTGRFLSTDPVSPSIGDPYVSAYAYVNGNPLRYTDPSGRCFIVCAVVGGVAGALVGGLVYVATTPVSDLSLGGFASHAALGGATGAIIGFTGGVAALAIGDGTLTTGGAALLMGTAGYVTGIGQAAGAKLIGDKVTGSTFAWNVVGGITAAVIGGASTGSWLQDLIGMRALVADAVSAASGVVAK